MRIESMEIEMQKKEVLKYILDKMPLMSRVVQFNTLIKDIHIQYIEFKLLNYEIISKEKSKKMFRYEIKKDNVRMLVNTFNGYSESVDNLPLTSKKYVSKKFIKESKMSEDDIVLAVKNEIVEFLEKRYDIDKISIQSINIENIQSIYKPYWFVDFKGRKILIDI